jgi:hypothetical protein
MSEHPADTMSIRNLGFSVRTETCLISDNITTVGELCRRSEQELLRIPNMGRKSIGEIRETLERLHLPPLRGAEHEPREPFDLPWVMARLRDMVEQYQTVPFVGIDGLAACLRVTYWDRATNSGITLVVGVEPAHPDDTE